MIKKLRTTPLDVVLENFVMKGAQYDMKDHMVSGQVRIFPNPRRSDYVTSGCSKDKLLTTNNH